MYHSSFPRNNDGSLFCRFSAPVCCALLNRPIVERHACVGKLLKPNLSGIRARSCDNNGGLEGGGGRGEGVGRVRKEQCQMKWRAMFADASVNEAAGAGKWGSASLRSFNYGAGTYTQAAMSLPTSIGVAASIIFTRTRTVVCIDRRQTFRVDFKKSSCASSDNYKSYHGDKGGGGSKKRNGQKRRRLLVPAATAPPYCGIYQRATPMFEHAPLLALLAGSFLAVGNFSAAVRVPSCCLSCYACLFSLSVSAFPFLLPSLSD